MSSTRSPTFSDIHSSNEYQDNQKAIRIHQQDVNGEEWGLVSKLYSDVQNMSDFKISRPINTRKTQILSNLAVISQHISTSVK